MVLQKFSKAAIFAVAVVAIEEASPSPPPTIIDITATDHSGGDILGGDIVYVEVPSPVENPKPTIVVNRTTTFVQPPNIGCVHEYDPVCAETCHPMLKWRSGGKGKGKGDKDGTDRDGKMGGKDRDEMDETWGDKKDSREGKKENWSDADKKSAWKEGTVHESDVHKTPDCQTTVHYLNKTTNVWSTEVVDGWKKNMTYASTCVAQFFGVTVQPQAACAEEKVITLEKNISPEKDISITAEHSSGPDVKTAKGEKGAGKGDESKDGKGKGKVGDKKEFHGEHGKHHHHHGNHKYFIMPNGENVTNSTSLPWHFSTEFKTWVNVHDWFQGFALDAYHKNGQHPQIVERKVEKKVNFVLNAVPEPLLTKSDGASETVSEVVANEMNLAAKIADNKVIATADSEDGAPITTSKESTDKRSITSSASGKSVVLFIALASLFPVFLV